MPWKNIFSLFCFLPDCSGVLFYHSLSWFLLFLAVLVFPHLGNESLPGRSPSIEKKPPQGCLLRFCGKNGYYQGRFSFCFTCYPDAAQTLALAQDHSMDIPSQDRLKVKSPHGDFFSCTEWPLLCTCGSWAPKAFS